MNNYYFLILIILWQTEKENKECFRYYVRKNEKFHFSTGQEVRTIHVRLGQGYTSD